MTKLHQTPIPQKSGPSASVCASDVRGVLCQLAPGFTFVVQDELHGVVLQHTPFLDDLVVDRVIGIEFAADLKAQVFMESSSTKWSADPVHAGHLEGIRFWMVPVYWASVNCNGSQEHRVRMRRLGLTGSS